MTRSHETLSFCYKSRRVGGIGDICIFIVLISLQLKIYLTCVFFPASNDFQKSSLHTLTRSITNLEVISPQNQIQPITTKHKAPFEQTFRLTVYLPHGQLYVARIGAKTKLVELLDTICADKLLDANKFDFRHPGRFKQNNVKVTKVIAWNSQWCSN